MPKKSSSNYIENSSSSSSKSVQSCTSSFTNYYLNNSNTNPSSSLSQSNNKLNQGKLIYLDKKFHTNSTNTNNSSQCVEIDYSFSSTNNYNDEQARENHKSNRLESTRIKRLSCEELENLKERFVDFIKLDSNNSTSSSNLPLPPSIEPISLPIIPPSSLLEPEETERSSSSSCLSSSPPSNNSDESIESTNIKEDMIIYSKLNENKDNINMSCSIVSSPLPSPTAALEAINENNRHLELQHNNNTNIKNANRLSLFSSESSSAESSASNNPNNNSIIYNNSIGETNRSSLNISSSLRPEPPQRTVSIRNSTCIYSSGLNLNQSNQAIRQQHQQQEADCLSIRSSVIYSTASNHLGMVKSSRSVFSIYEGSEEDEGCSTTTTSSSSIQSSKNNSSPTQMRLERLADFEVKKIESMYRSIGSLVCVSSCTCNFYTTTSEQIANLLNDCWNLDLNSCVPVWIFDTGFNLKRTKRLQLLFVDRYTSFPLIKQPILIDKFNKLKYPNNNNNDKKLTFTMKNKQLICLIQFYDYFSCQEFYKFYSDLTLNQCFSDLFAENPLQKSENSFELSAKKSKSMMSLYFPGSNSNVTFRNSSRNVNKANNSKKRYSEFIPNIDVIPSNMNKSMMRPSVTTGNLKQLGHNSQTNLNNSITITKNCISNPCAFQHINHLTDQDHLKLKFKNILVLNEKISDSGGGRADDQIDNLTKKDINNKHHDNYNYVIKK